MEYDAGLAKLEGRAKFATAVLWVFVAVAVPTAFGQLLEATGTIDLAAVDVDPLSLGIAIAYVTYFAVFVASVVIVAMWIHRAHANLADAGVDGLEFTPGWAVGWYFIPFANLFKPFQAMRELWRASHGERNEFGGPAPSEVTAWWTCWIAGNILSRVGDRIVTMSEGGANGLMVGSAMGAAGTALHVVAAVLLAKLIRTVTQAQRGGTAAAGVFA